MSGTGGTEGGAGTSGADGGDASDGGHEAEAGPTCTNGVGQVVEGCPIEDPNGIFVSVAAAASTADGSRAHPFPNITRAITAASSADGGLRDAGASGMRRLYVCSDGGAYAETLKLDASRDGLALLGGFRCSDWKYDPAKRTKLASLDRTALTVSGVVKGVTIEDFEITSTDATASTTSSIAMIVNQASKSVVLRRVSIAAGKGADGARGLNGNDGVDGLIAGPEQAGKPAVCVNPPTSQYFGYWTHTQAVPYGGNGGAGWLNMNGERGTYATPQTNVTPPNIDNGGAGATTLGANGTNGGPGSRGNDGAPAASFSIADSFGPTGYRTGFGGYGVDGYPAQGGGGGGSSKGSATCAAPSGGAGGVGGTGGKHGTGGSSGGVSVALYVWDSAVTLTNVTLVSENGGTGGDGGNGGLGGKGQAGGPGGQGNAANTIGAAGGGGKGGDGGDGGSGAGGNGGHSYPLLFHGPAPTQVGVVYTPGQPGQPGGGGFTSGANGVIRAPNGTIGEAAVEHAVP